MSRTLECLLWNHSIECSVGNQHLVFSHIRFGGGGGQVVFSTGGWQCWYTLIQMIQVIWSHWLEQVILGNLQTTPHRSFSNFTNFYEISRVTIFWGGGEEEKIMERMGDKEHKSWPLRNLLFTEEILWGNISQQFMRLFSFDYRVIPKVTIMVF